VLSHGNKGYCGQSDIGAHESLGTARHCARQIRRFGLLASLTVDDASTNLSHFVYHDVGRLRNIQKTTDRVVTKQGASKYVLDKLTLPTSDNSVLVVQMTAQTSFLDSLTAPGASSQTKAKQMYELASDAHGRASVGNCFGRLTCSSGKKRATFDLYQVYLQPAYRGMKRNGISIVVYEMLMNLRKVVQETAGNKTVNMLIPSGAPCLLNHFGSTKRRTAYAKAFIEAGWLISDNAANDYPIVSSSV